MYTHIHAHMYTHTHTYTCTCLHMHVHTLSYTYRYLHTHVYIPIYTIMLTHIHSCAIANYGSEFGSTDKTVNQIRAEIDMQLKEKENIEKTLPQNIVIGPFYVNCDTIRQALSKKRKELANALLEYVVSRLKRKADEVSTSLLSIFHCISIYICMYYWFNLKLLQLKKAKL